MDSRDVYNLYSAYRSVYEDRESLNEDVDYELEESKGEGPEAATSGTQLFQQLFRGSKKRRGSKEAPMDTSRFQGKGSKAKRRMNNEELDLYDVVLDHLLDEGYCDNVESAEVIMANMSEEWVDEIVEGYKPLPIASMLKQASRHGENAGRAGDDLTPSLKRARRVGGMMGAAERHSAEKSQAKSSENFRRGAARRG